MLPESEYYSYVPHDFCISYKNRPEPFNMKSYHYHNVYEIYYFITGERRFFYCNKIYHITPNDVVFVKKYERHGVCDWEEPGHSRILIDFKDDFLEHFPSEGYDLFECFNKGVTVLSLNAPDRDIILPKFQNLLEEFNKNECGKRALMKAQLAEIMISLARLQDVYGDKREPMAQNQATLYRIMKYINDNYNRNLSIQEIADYIGYSKNYLCSFFKKNSGFSLIEYLNGVRIKQAQEYLRTTNLSITEIAILCGFDNLTHFGRVFRVISACSPLQYRKNFHKWEG